MNIGYQHLHSMLSNISSTDDELKNSVHVDHCLESVMPLSIGFIGALVFSVERLPIHKRFRVLSKAGIVRLIVLC